MYVIVWSAYVKFYIQYNHNLEFNRIGFFLLLGIIFGFEPQVYYHEKVIISLYYIWYTLTRNWNQSNCKAKYRIILKKEWQESSSEILDVISSCKHGWLTYHFYIYGILLFTAEDTAYFFWMIHWNPQKWNRNSQV